MHRRTECEAAGRKRDISFSWTRSSGSCRRKLGLVDTNRSTEVPGEAPPSQPSDVGHRLIGEQEAVGAKVGS